MIERNSLQVDVSLFEDVPRVLLAVSGGADSVAMAHGLSALRKAGRLSCEFVIGHVNHCLRGDASDADEAFVKELAGSLGVPVVTQSVDVVGYAEENKLSIETAGRTLRLKTLAAMAEAQECDAIATAHHADDQAETLIHRLMRGTGFRGLCGIRPISYIGDAKFVRPMLAVRRDEIIQYCKDRSIRWREDASNQNLGFTRNRIRHKLLPEIERRVGTAHPTGGYEIVNKLQKLSQQCCRFQLFTEKRAQSIVDKGQYNQTADSFTIDQELLKDAACWVFYEVVREVLVKLSIGLRPYTRAHFDMIAGLIGKKRTRRMLPNGLVVRAMADKLVFVKSSQASQQPIFPESPVQLTAGATVEFGPWKISCRLLDRSDVDVKRFLETKDNFVELFDADKICGPLMVRCRRDGDRFRPIGSKAEKKIARFLQDGQLDGRIKQQAFIVKDVEKVLWVAPIRMSEAFKISGTTRRIVEISIRRKESILTG